MKINDNDNNDIIMICDYNTYIRQIKFIQGHVISSKYTVNEYVHNVPRQNLNIIQENLYNAHRQNLKSIYHYNKDLVIQYLIHD
jgi:hypothetical protein